ncbi:MAG: translocon at inner membrane of chloroplasts 21 [Trebouxia sp. A1-2]|nr:MAG: translocon at inner membrane of chloroplasts 21 [Trebouxia sp. A1-2]
MSRTFGSERAAADILHVRQAFSKPRAINKVLPGYRISYNLDVQNGPSISLWLTLFGVVAGFLSTFWSFGYTRLSRRLYRYLSTGPDDNSKRVKKADVLNTLMRGSWINVLGLGSTLLGLQATVGLLVAKTLTNATANPFLAGGAGSYNPVLALDVFLVQASTNTLLSHFASLVLSLWLIRIVGRNPTPTSGSPAKS